MAMKNDNNELRRNSVRHDAFDRAAYEDILYQSKELQSLSTQGYKN